MAARVFLALLLAATPAGLSMVPDGDFAASGGLAPASRWTPAPRGQGYAWPTGAEVAVLRPFEPPSVPWGSGHRGADLALSPGSPVFAAADGTVVFAGKVVDRPVVSVDHADGIRTTYEPVVPAVSAGEPVQRGQSVGTLAAGHCAGGCLHFGARTGPDRYLDPLLLLHDPVIRLLPW